MPPDFFQFGGLQSRVLFQQAQRVAAFNGSVLRGIAGEDQAALLFFGERGHPRQGAGTQQPGLIHPNHLAPDLFLKARDTLQLRSDELLIFEDSRNGILAANRAGIRVVAVPNPITAHDTHEGASLLLASLADLPLEDLLKQFDHR